MLVRWERDAWEEYCRRQIEDRRILKRINTLITDVLRNGNEGIGKPEPLKHDFSGYWSRRINSEHRLIYKIDDGGITIVACRYHYGE
ncbi:Txe/YoeB family addiction module toxin [Corynebacterium aquatimens]|uniref:Txe/YoeB family addiction module toxin n=1 Tax=Corynebacterium TaxID=1716 RepID=UPI001F18E434|nr:MULTISPECIES: Txe/YoeB family addiction module toxin [Corynebacterium]QYH19720.1 Txe/YoeB family addiction module toxin [Corynebacterium aquatimens]UIZ93183.1 Txe/YoeB family addiction module toxin [Corynebacterium sp. CNCTC7651]